MDCTPSNPGHSKWLPGISQCLWINTKGSCTQLFHICVFLYQIISCKRFYSQEPRSHHLKTICSVEFGLLPYTHTSQIRSNHNSHFCRNAMHKKKQRTSCKFRGVSTCTALTFRQMSSISILHFLEVNASERFENSAFLFPCLCKHLLTGKMYCATLVIHIQHVKTKPTQPGLKSRPWTGQMNCTTSTAMRRYTRFFGVVWFGVFFPRKESAPEYEKHSH